MGGTINAFEQVVLTVSFAEDASSVCRIVGDPGSRHPISGLAKICVGTVKYQAHSTVRGWNRDVECDPVDIDECAFQNFGQRFHRVVCGSPENRTAPDAIIRSGSARPDGGASSPVPGAMGVGLHAGADNLLRRYVPGDHGRMPNHDLPNPLYLQTLS